jgi:hypothetical protein
MRVAALTWYAVCVAVFAGLPLTRCSKLPSWLGPDFFFDGTLPSGRNEHGFEVCDDGKIYIFGGDDQNGETSRVLL